MSRKMHIVKSKFQTKRLKNMFFNSCYLKYDFQICHKIYSFKSLPHLKKLIYKQGIYQEHTLKHRVID